MIGSTPMVYPCSASVFRNSWSSSLWSCWCCGCCVDATEAEHPYVPAGVRLSPVARAGSQRDRLRLRQGPRPGAGCGDAPAPGQEPQAEQELTEEGDPGHAQGRALTQDPGDTVEDVAGARDDQQNRDDSRDERRPK